MLRFFTSCTTFLLLVLAGYWAFYSSPAPEVLHVYNWYAMLPSDLLEEFQNETGIHVRYDLYDSNEIVEAKLLAGNSGYDVVFPSASPYIKRHIEAGAYQKLSRESLPNLVHLDPMIVKKMETVDPENTYAIPYYWGTFGFAYVEEEIQKRLPNAPIQSSRMLFDPEVVKHFQGCGVTLLDEAVDVYPAVLAYLGESPDSKSIEDLEKAHAHLMKLRPSINRFSSSRFVSELASGESCLAQAWSGEAQLAQKKAEEMGKSIHIHYVVPEEGGTLWIDAIVIPKDAPHVENAHKFINFLLRPDVAARISNVTQLAIANQTAFSLVEKEIRENKTIFPSTEVIHKLHLDQPQEVSYDQYRTRLWTHLKTRNS